MKTNKLIALLLALFFLPALANAQTNIMDPKDPKYGADSVSRIECLKSMSLYGDLIRSENYKEARKFWAKVFTICPGASQNTYINGVKLYKSLIEAEANQTVKSHYIDTLMKLYDKRIEYFNRRGYVLGRKALDVVKYLPDSLIAAYKLFNESIDIQKEKSEEVVIASRFLLSKQLYDKGLISAEEMLNMYSVSADYLGAQLAAKPEDKLIRNAKESVELIYATSQIASCENLENVFGPKYKAAPSDLEQNKKIATMLANAGCNGQLFADINEAIYAQEPSAEAAYNLARIFDAKGEHAKAEAYYKDAISKQGNAGMKSKYYLSLSGLYNRKNDKPSAKVAAYNAINADANNGKAYMMLGDIYAGVRNCGNTNFAKQTIYWLVVDKYTKAKQVDPTLAEEANKLIANYSQYFPKKEDVFFQGLKNGQAITIGCWINETTYVRY